ncbi:MAG TPA: CHASE3 domain-containing protein, partial [Chitinophagaceae bacterium]
MIRQGSLQVKTGYFTAFVLLVVSYILIFITLQHLLRETKWVEHTDLVITDLHTLLANTSEAESAARGYVLFNDPDELQTFYSTTRSVDLLLRKIDSVTSDNESQQKNTDTLKLMIQEKLGRTYRAILLFQQAGNAFTPEMKDGGEVAKKLMENIRALVTKMELHESRLLRVRKERLRAVSASIKIITITSLTIALLLSAYSFITYSKENTAKSRSNEQAERYRLQLEKKVSELQDANNELHELRSLEKFTATGRIARTIAHEIRNPLTNIVLAADQIEASPASKE